MGGLLGAWHCPSWQRIRPARITRIIGLGTPHGGSIGAVQAVRATYPVFPPAAVDPLHGAAELSRNVFGTFPRSINCCPATRAILICLIRPPGRAAEPSPTGAARAARVFSSQLAPADARFISIIGAASGPPRHRTPRRAVSL